MPINKIKGSKKVDGLCKYEVRISYQDQHGKWQRLTRRVWGQEAAKDLEKQLSDKYVGQVIVPVSKMTVQELFDEYMKYKQARETTKEKNRCNFKYYVKPTMGHLRIDKLDHKLLEEWKVTLNKRNLALNTKKQAFNDFRALLNYAVRAKHLLENPMSSIKIFADPDMIVNQNDKIKFYTPEEFIKFITIAKEIAEDKQQKQNEFME